MADDMRTCPIHDASGLCLGNFACWPAWLAGQTLVEYARTLGLAFVRRLAQQHMFTPELSSDEKGEYVLISNHSLHSIEAVHLSIAYNRARIAHGAPHLPPHFRTCRLIYDIRGQVLPESAIDQIRQELGGVCVLEFMR